MRAIFLDRDGTINREVDNLRNVRELKILPHVARAISQLNRLGFLVIVISNQPVVARGWLSEQGVDEINNVLLKRLAKKDARIDAIYYCPHHPNANKQKYCANCRCRKPNIGMIQKAVKYFKIDLNKSFFIGDSTRDMLAGSRAGVKTILVKTGYGGNDKMYKVKPDAIAKNLYEAVTIIKKWQPK